MRRARHASSHLLELFLRHPACLLGGLDESLQLGHVGCGR